jgi:hypothetical protein
MRCWECCLKGFKGEKVHFLNRSRKSCKISIFFPLGCRTMLQFLARRAAESNAFSVPDRNALWSRAEDDLLVQAAVKHGTSDVLFPDWSEVVSELPGRYKQQCKERYRLADTVVELTFVFLRVTFRGSPFLRSSHVLTKDADSADSARPTFDACPPSPAPCLSPPSSLTLAHRCIGSRNPTRHSVPNSARLTHLSVYGSRDGAPRCIESRNPTRHSVPNSARLTHLSVYESRDGVSEPASSPSLLTHVHRCIGSRNPTRHSVPNSARLMHLSMYDSRDGVSEPAPFPSPPSSLTHAHSIQSHTLLTPTLLTFMCTQVLWCLARLARSRASGVTMDPDIRLTILSTRATQCMRGV